MKATYFMGHETFEVRECPIPKAKPGTVVVKNYACGVCGTVCTFTTAKRAARGQPAGRARP